ncbi:MAG: YicC/YloC family endoribonuclease [Chthoniobacterales bacterium]
MNSMTGYGRGEAATSGMRCVVECASVNRKGLEVVCQMPRDIAALEVSIREAVARRIPRGRVNINVTLASAAVGGAAEIDRALAGGLLREIRSLQKELSLSGDVDVNTLLSLPGVIRMPQQTAADYEPSVLHALEIALGALGKMRAKEGKSLLADLSKRLAFLRKARTRMARLAPDIVKRYRDELRARIGRSGIEIDIDDARLATEVALFAERCDISEELTRLDSHFAQLEEMLEASAPVGRALEFLTQEIQRELNTLGSKAGDSALTRIVVESKVELDKIREQVLNVE